MAVIDNLEIQIKAQANKANNAIDNLITRLNGLNTALGSISGANLTSLASGVNDLSAAMQGMKAVGTADFTRLKTNIEKLGTIDVQNLNRVASGLRQITNAFSKLSGTAAQATAVKELASAISRLGYKSVANAIQNMPALSTALKNMLTELATVPAISRNVVDLTTAIANLAAASGRVGQSSNSMSNAFSRMSLSSMRAKKNMFSLAAAFGRFYASYFLVLRAIKGMWKSVESSMDYVETYNYFSVTMAKIGKDFAKQQGKNGEESAEAYAESFQKRLNELTSKITGYKIGENGELISTGLANLGADPEVLMNFQAKIGAVTNSVGLLGETSVNTQKALSMLAYDLSSLKNENVEDVMNNLSSAMIGQSRAVYRYGVDITNASLKQVALEHNVTKTVSSMTQAQKMQLRLLALLEQTEIAYGDMANTVSSVSNMYRIFTQQINNLRLILGNLFLPLVQKALPAINGFIIALKDLFTMLGTTIWGDTWLTGIMDGISQGNFGIEELEEDLDGIGDALDGDTSAAKKLKQQLQGFDELNVINTKTDNSNLSFLNEDLGLADDIASALEKYESVWNRAFANMSNKSQDFAKKFKEMLAPVSAFIQLLANGKFKAAGKLLGSMFSGLISNITEALGKVDWKEVGTKIGEFLEGIGWTDILRKIIELKFKIWEIIADVWFSSFETAPIETALLTAFGLLNFTPVGALVSKGLSETIKASIASFGGIGKMLTMDMSLLGASSAVEIGTFIGTSIIGGIAAAFVGYNFGKVLGQWLFPKDKEVYKNFRIFGEGGFFHGVFGGYNSLGEWFAIQSAAVMSMATDFRVKIEDFFKKMISSIIDNIKTSLNLLKSFLTTFINNRIDDFSKFVGNLIKILSPALNALTTISTVGTSGIFGGISGIKIPGFASGGFIGDASLFMAGENGVPELLGTVGGRTAVASGEEITGIKEAVYESGDTQAQLLSTAVSLLQIIAEKDFGASADYIFNSYNNSAREYTNRTGLRPV